MSSATHSRTQTCATPSGTSPSTTEPLFDVDLGAPLPELTPMSAGQRLTALQHQAIADGRHPLTKLPLLEPRSDEHRCGTCCHRSRGGSRGYPKCNLTTITSGPATDCRAWWPACQRWEPKP